MPPHGTVQQCSCPSGLEPDKGARDKEQPHVPERLCCTPQEMIHPQCRDGSDSAAPVTDCRDRYVDGSELARTFFHVCSIGRYVHVFGL